MKFADLVKYAHVFSIDLKHIHWHATGDKFDTIHTITDELGKEAAAEVDDFAEMAISSGEAVESLNQLDELDDWTPATDGDYDWDKFVSFLSTNGLKYLECLQDIETDNSGYQSLVDEYIAFWSKEINYKNANRAIENPETDTSDTAVAAPESETAEEPVEADDTTPAEDESPEDKE